MDNYIFTLNRLYLILIRYFIFFFVFQSPVPNSYPNPSATCTLPRHPNHQQQHWPSYGGTIAGVRHIPQVQICGSQQPPPPSAIAMQHLNSRTRICIAVPEDEPSAETPLMVKRESTV